MKTGNDRFVWAHSFSVVILLFGGALSLINGFNIRFLVMAHRVWQTVTLGLDPGSQWILGVVLVTWACLSLYRGLGYLTVLPFLAFSGLPFFDAWVVLGLASWVAVALSFLLIMDLRLLEAFLYSFMCFSLLAACYWLILHPFNVEACSGAAQLEVKTYYLAASFAPWMVLALGAVSFFKAVGRGETRGREEPLRVRGRRTYPALLLIAVVSAGTVIYMYLPGVNPQGITPGVDFLKYLSDMEVVEGDPQQILTVHGGERPFLFLVVYLLEKATSLNSLTVLKYLNLLLFPLLVLCNYVFSLELTHDESTALWSCLFLVFGYVISVGAYSYFIANVLGLSLIYLSLTLLFKAINSGCPMCLATSILLNGLTLFTHPWTFIQFNAPLLVSIALIGFRRKGDSEGALYIGLYLLGGIIFELLKGAVLGQYGGLMATQTFYTQLTTLSNLLKDLQLGTVYTFGGNMANVVLIALAIIGLTSTRIRTSEGQYFLLLILASMAVFTLGNAEIKSRILYNAPVHILAATGLSWPRKNFSPSQARLLTFSIIVYMYLNLFRSLANII
jgi:hypothetical protein